MNERELKDGYKQVVITIAGTLGWRRTPGVLMPNDEVVPYHEAPDECFAPEPKLPEFRKGDWIRGPIWRDGKPVKTFLRVLDPAYSVQDISTVNGYGGIYLIRRVDAELIEHSPSRPTGPPVVGSTVVVTGGIGRVDKIEPWRFEFVHVCWPNGNDFWYKASELIHLCSPKEIT